MEPRKLSDIAEMLGGELVGSADPLISGASGIENASPGDLTFVVKKNLLNQLGSCKASAVLIGPEMETELPAIRLANPYAGFADFLELFLFPLEQIFPTGVHATAIIDPTADVSNADCIGPYCVIGAGSVVGKGCLLESHVSVGPGVSIGEDCRIYSQVSIREGCIVGNRVMLHSGVRIGTDGFGFLPGKAGLKKIPQVGIVVIEDDVEIGSNCCIDRATTGCTVIGTGTKLDNLIQVGHNVRLGSHCVLSGQSGIAGSTTIGNGVAVGGGVSVGDHLKVGDGAQLAGKSGVIRDVPAGATQFGYPAIDFKESFRLFGALRKLPELIRRVRKLEELQANLDD